MPRPLRILHATHMTQPTAGVLQQMTQEQEVAEQLDIRWQTRAFVPPETLGKICVNAPVSSRARLRFKQAYYSWLTTVAPDYDLLLLRYTLHDPLQLFFVSRCPIPVYTVHHTLEVPELQSQPGAANRVKSLAERMLGLGTLGKVRGFVGVTKEIAEYERARSGNPAAVVHVYPNGINLAEHPPLADNRSTDRSTEPVEILFVASSFYLWNGLDLLLEAARQRSDLDVKIHLVGKLDAQQQATVEQDHRFVIHETQASAYIQNLASRCTLGLSTLALFRKNMQEACPLKTREYLAYGLPVYGGYIDVFPPEFRYFKNGPCDLAAIIDFAHAMRAEPRQRVRDEAAPYIDKAALLDRLYTDLKQDFAKRGAR